MLGSAAEIVHHISQDVRDAMTAFRTARAEPNEEGDVQVSARERTSLRNMHVPPPKRSSQLPRGSMGAAMRRIAETHASVMGSREHELKSDNHPASSSTARCPLVHDGNVRSHDKFDDDSEVGSEPSQAPANTERSFAGWSRNFPAMQISQELEDLVCLMTRAHRAGQRYNGKGDGEFVWLSYNARTGRGRRESPSFGSHLFAFTRTFAIEFLNHLWTVKPDHADLVLRAWLIDNAARVGASYLFPACGACETHESGCQQGLGVRETTFGAKWVGNGFRGAGGHRYLRQWKQGEAPAYLTDAINWDEPGFEWRTARPPQQWTHPEYQEELWRR